MYWSVYAGSVDALGYIPDFLSNWDEESAAAQINKNYSHGGGWSPMNGWKFDPVTSALVYPGDQPMKPLAETMLRDERILVYPSAWVAIVQPNGAFQVAKVD
jgi:hypothetical protein